jgi:FkbM family methyltransferase
MNISEIVRQIWIYGETQQGVNPIKEFSFVLSCIVHADIAQAKQALGIPANEDKQYSFFRIYAQRLVEISYIFTEVFLRDEYVKWQSDSTSPRVIDLGGDPGAFSAIYWKHKQPNARISVVEANPATTETMKRSLERKNMRDIQIINAAVAEDDIGCVSLHLHQPGHGWHTQDFIGGKGVISDGSGYSIEVPKLKLSSLIGDNEQVDLLKIDIEGSEGDIIRELNEADRLRQVKQIIMEFHHGPVDFPNNSLVEMVNILTSAGFVIDDAHITSGKGLRSKKQIAVSDFEQIARSNQKTYLTFRASRRN